MMIFTWNRIKSNPFEFIWMSEAALEKVLDFPLKLLTGFRQIWLIEFELRWKKYMHLSCLRRWCMYSCCSLQRFLCSENTKRQSHIIIIINFIGSFYFKKPSSADCNSSQSQSMANCWAGVSFRARIRASALLSNAFAGSAAARVHRLFPCECRCICYISNWWQSWSDTR